MTAFSLTDNKFVVTVEDEDGHTYPGMCVGVHFVKVWFGSERQTFEHGE